MKDEHLMKPPVSASSEGSRFASTPLPSDHIVNKLSTQALPAVSRVLPSRFSVSLPEESMVLDDRSSLTPAQMVESKLMSRLRESSLPMSHLQMRGLIRARYEA